MIVLLMALLSYVALVLDAGCGSWSLPAATMPHFLYLAAAAAVLTCRGPGAIIVAALAGLLADVVSGGQLGLNVVLLANLTFLAQLFGARKSNDSILTSAAFVLMYVTIAGLGGIIARDVLAGGLPDFPATGIFAVSRAGGTAAVFLAAMLVWRLLARSTRLIIPRRTISHDRPRWAQ